MFRAVTPDVGDLAVRAGICISLQLVCGCNCLNSFLCTMWLSCISGFGFAAAPQQQHPPCQSAQPVSFLFAGLLFDCSLICFVCACKLPPITSNLHACESAPKAAFGGLACPIVNPSRLGRAWPLPPS